MLAEIVAQKRIDVAARQRVRSLQSLLDAVTPSTRSLERALRQPGARLICECKRASPSQGLIREDFDPETIARSYASFASAMSVITDAPFFSGDLRFIEQARRGFDGPILCKDFVLGPYQVAEARHYGADAVLLMLSVLDDETVRACQAMAERLSMNALVEVHDAAELDRALALDARIIGINNRNLKTLDVSLSVTEELAARVPHDRVLVSESGVRTRADLQRLGPHVDGFLIGTSLMKQPDLDAALRRLLFGRVKICGLTRAEDAAHAYRCGASFGGLIFASRSPRCMTRERARDVIKGAPLQWAGVFVNAPIEQVAGLADTLRLSAVQLHGHEDAGYRQRLRAQLPRGCALWQAAAVDASGIAPDTLRVRIEAAQQHSDRVLLDSRVIVSSDPQNKTDAEAVRSGEEKMGGTGVAIEGALLDAIALDEVLVAGGLNPTNIASVMARAPWAADVNSGVESAPGHKSHPHITALLEALRPSDRGQHRNSS